MRAEIRRPIGITGSLFRYSQGFRFCYLGGAVDFLCISRLLAHIWPCTYDVDCLLNPNERYGCIAYIAT